MGARVDAIMGGLLLLLLLRILLLRLLRDVGLAAAAAGEQSNQLSKVPDDTHDDEGYDDPGVTAAVVAIHGAERDAQAQAEEDDREDDGRDGERELGPIPILVKGDYARRCSVGVVGSQLLGWLRGLLVGLGKRAMLFLRLLRNRGGRRLRRRRRCVLHVRR